MHNINIAELCDHHNKNFEVVRVLRDAARGHGFPCQGWLSALFLDYTRAPDSGASVSSSAHIDGECVMPRVTALLVALGVLPLPLIYSRATIDPVTVPRFILLAGLILAMAIIVLAQSRRKLAEGGSISLPSGMLVAFLAYLAVATLSLTQAVNHQEALFDLLKAVLAFAFYAAAVMALRDQTNARLIVTRVLPISALAIAAMGLGQYMGICCLDVPGNIVPYGPMTNKNLLSSALFLLMPFLVYGVFQLRGRWRAIALAALALSLVVIAVGQTRAVWLAISVALPAAGLLALAAKLGKRWRRVIAGLTLVATLAVASVVAYDATRDSVDERLVLTVDDHNLQTRLMLWGKTSAMIAEHPVLGVGIGNWRIAIPKYGIAGRSFYAENTYFQRPHNDLYGVLAETGPLGLICYLAVFCFGGLYCWRLLNTDDREGRILALTMFAGLVGYLVIASFSYPRERISHTLFLMLILAFVSSGHCHRFRGTRTLPLSWLRAGAAAVALAACFALVVGFHRLNAEVHTKRAVAAAQANAWATAVKELDLARSSLVTVDPTSTPHACYRGVANSSLSRMDSAFYDYQDALRANPYHLQVLNNIATLYEQRGDHAAALEYYGRALQASPALEQTLVNLAAVYYNLGQYGAALECLTQDRVGPADPRYDEFLRIVSDRVREAEAARPDSG